MLGKKKVKEIEKLKTIINDFGNLARSEVVAEVSSKGESFPIHVVEVGSANPEDPVIGFFGGIHGLEKIGSEVILAFMESLTSLIRWDESFKKRLKHSRMLFMPIINPVGVWQNSRANGNGVDIMRNSPVESRDKSKWIFSGHRISPLLPWYRGAINNEMEIEAQALCKVVKERMFSSKLSLAVDVHSGFGANDRFWFPYARALDIFPNISEVMALIDLFEKTYPHHVYTIEPTSHQYTIHGDLWDYLTDEFFSINSQTQAKDKIFLPWTLEMGSWAWLKKNPLQLFNPLGLYHPLIPHRRQRIFRRHLSLFDFLHRSVLFSDIWLQLNTEDANKYYSRAKEKWYA